MQNEEKKVQNSTEASNDGNTVLAAVRLSMEEIWKIQTKLRSYARKHSNIRLL